MSGRIPHINDVTKNPEGLFVSKIADSMSPNYPANVMEIGYKHTDAGGSSHVHSKLVAVGNEVTLEFGITLPKESMDGATDRNPTWSFSVGVENPVISKRDNQTLVDADDDLYRFVSTVSKFVHDETAQAQLDKKLPKAQLPSLPVEEADETEAQYFKRVRSGVTGCFSKDFNTRVKDDGTVSVRKYVNLAQYRTKEGKTVVKTSFARARCESDPGFDDPKMRDVPVNLPLDSCVNRPIVVVPYYEVYRVYLGARKTIQWQVNACFVVSFPESESGGISMSAFSGLAAQYSGTGSGVASAIAARPVAEPATASPGTDIHDALAGAIADVKASAPAPAEEPASAGSDGEASDAEPTPPPAPKAKAAPKRMAFKRKE